MKGTYSRLLLCALTLTAVSAASAETPLGTQFTYQGLLRQSGNPLNGTVDMQFLLFDEETGGNQIGSTVELLGVPVNDGLFTVQLDFGVLPAFNGNSRWLEIAVQIGGGAMRGVFTTFAQRQPLTAAPYALETKGIVVDATNQVAMGGATPTNKPLIVGTNTSNGNGAYLSKGGVWTNTCDRNKKTNFTAVDPKAVLATLRTVPVTRWEYRNDPDGARHMGPTAQDFHAAFGLGDSDKAIGTVDVDGVLMAAVQGLNTAVDEKEAEIARQKRQIAELESRLARLEAAMKADSTKSTK